MKVVTSRMMRNANASNRLSHSATRKTMDLVLRSPPRTLPPTLTAPAAVAPIVAISTPPGSAGRGEC